MAHKPKAAPEVVQEWKAKLAEAAAALDQAREAAAVAEQAFRACVVDSFDAGLSVTPIMEATGRSLGRIYQIKRGTRR
jgi:hypothetical protein